MTQKMSNTQKLAENLMINIGNSRYTHFDDGVSDGSGTWYDCFLGENEESRNLTARAVNANVKAGYIVKEYSPEDSDHWMYLTEAGAAKALELKEAELHGIAAEAPAKAPTGERATTDFESYTGAGCKCGCGAPTSGKKASYRPGHDARHVSRLVRAIKAASPEESALLQQVAAQDLSDKLLMKLTRALTK